MISAGNDIVSLNAINVARTKQPRFYSKILSDAELTLHKQPGFEAVRLENFVWLFWSIKESAFKFVQRLQPDLLFTPVKIEITQLSIPAVFIVNDFNAGEITATGFDDNALKAAISIAGIKLYSRSVIYNSFILSVVNSTDNFDNICWGVKVISDTHHEAQSAAVRNFLAERLQTITGSEDLSVTKNLQGIPVLSNPSNDAAIPVSLSHHSQLVSYSF